MRFQNMFLLGLIVTLVVRLLHVHWLHKGGIYCLSWEYVFLIEYFESFRLGCALIVENNKVCFFEHLETELTTESWRFRHLSSTLFYGFYFLLVCYILRYNTLLIYLLRTLTLITSETIILVLFWFCLCFLSVLCLVELLPQAFTLIL